MPGQAGAGARRGAAGGPPERAKISCNTAICALVLSGTFAPASLRIHALFGGGAGGTGRFLLRSPDKTTRLDNKPNAVKVPRDSAIVIETPGAGGYGPPSERTADSLRADRETGKFSDDYLARHYGTEDRS